ncbi:MAG: hypothetical protein A2Y15_02410 [Clostridiales bacterium GWF2_36_10]|nr:MAG: hypothetical protein A2Y15_02410 [Clostridiales bacterium GWF2_36_10]
MSCGNNTSHPDDIIKDENVFKGNLDIEKSNESDSVKNTADKLTFKGWLCIRGFFSVYFLSAVCVFLFSALVYIISRLSPDFAEFWTRYPAYWLKFLLAKLTTWLSFSVAEWFLLSVPILIIAYFIASWRAMNKAVKPSDFYKWLLPLICVLLIIVSIFFTAFGPAYFRYSLDKNLSLERKGVSGQELYDTAIKLSKEMENIIDNVNFRYTESSVMPYSYDELAKKINFAFKSYVEKVDYLNSFESYPKPIAFSEQFTYTHISGVYTFMTGEANINVNYPDYIIPFTMAHEMAHQRGIAREDEANFVAYLVCMESDDSYIRYSGYSNMMQYVLNALYAADKTLYTDFYNNNYPIELRTEFSAYSLFFDKYRESKVSNVAQTVNDAFIKTQGQTEGIKSYGLVVDLTVAYYKNK